MTLETYPIDVTDHCPWCGAHAILHAHVCGREVVPADEQEALTLDDLDDFPE